MFHLPFFIGAKPPGWSQRLVLIAVTALVLFQNKSVAQIIPDTTLPSNSQVRLQDNIRFIEAGTQAGSNLFHSFQEFSVPNSTTAHFNNTPDIQNIISRVTGGSVSNINGLIRANASANLFLINPSGIIFSPQAQLDIKGSFVASTANSIKFADGMEFSAKNATSTPLLTVSVPVGLQFGVNPGPIKVLGDGLGLRKKLEPIDTTNALRVEPNQTLALVGGDVSLEGATLKTSGGRIELGSVVDSGFVSLTPTKSGFSFGYTDAKKLGNIQLFTEALVDASGETAGDIQILGNNLTLNDSRIETSTRGTKSGGSLVVDARESVNITGGLADDKPGAGLYANVLKGATGNGASLTIKTGTLLVENGAFVSTGTFGAGNAGNLTVDAQQIKIIGRSNNSQFASSLNASAWENSTGNAGDLTIKTDTLLLRDGAQVVTGTFAQGNAGKLTVDAQNVELIGTTADGKYSSGLFASADSKSTGNAGDLRITTNSLLVRNGALVLTITFSQGKGGNLTVDAQNIELIGTSPDGEIPSVLAASAEGENATGLAGNLNLKTGSLLLKDGGLVAAATSGPGRGGNLTVNAQKVEVIGSSAYSQFGTGFSSAAMPNSTGAAGNLTIDTDSLLVQDGAKITVESRGQGNAGGLTIRANSIVLDNNAILAANTRSINTDANQQQATINISSQDLILRRGSKITASATGEKVIGGNININNNILAILENSNILANSTEFQGGRVIINSQGVVRSRDSIIDAIGKTPELRGEVQIRTPDAEITRGTVVLPIEIVDATRLVNQNFCALAYNSRFIITGRGGIAPSPYEIQDSYTTWEDWRANPQPFSGRQPGRQPGRQGVREQDEQGEKKENFPLSTTPWYGNTLPTKIIEAQGWVINKKGQVELVALAPTNVTPHSLQNNLPTLPLECER